MLVSFVPPALVLAPICPAILAVALLHVLRVLSVVPDAVRVEVDSMTFHIVHVPLTIVFASIMPQVYPIAVNLIIDPLTFEGAAVGPGIFTSALLLRVRIIAGVLSAFSPCLDTRPMLKVIFPVAFVACTLDVRIDAKAIRFIVYPGTIVDISVGVEEFSITTRLIELKITLVARPIHPHHRASAMAQATLPLARVDGSSSIRVNLMLEARVVTVPSYQCLLCFIYLEVLAMHLVGLALNAISTPLQEPFDKRLDLNQLSHLISIDAIRIVLHELTLYITSW